MLDIMKSIYDMMGKYTYPTMQDDAPREHVESFFQARDKSLDVDTSVPTFILLLKKKPLKQMLLFFFFWFFLILG